MSVSESLRFIEVLAWPVVALITLAVVRPHILRLLSGAKVTISIAGQGIETTLPELKQIFEEQSSEPLSPEQIRYLQELHQAGAKQYPGGIKESADRKLLRPLRNIGLVLAIPRNEFLQDATGIELSALGRLFLQAKNIGK